MKQQRHTGLSKWIFPSLGILNLLIIAIVIPLHLVHAVFRGLIRINGIGYRFANRTVQWAMK